MIGLFGKIASRSFVTSKAPLKVAVTGAAGNIGYAILPRIASGQLLGLNQPIELQLLERPEGLKALRGVEMELLDGAYPLLKKITCTDNLDVAFGDVDYALLIGSKPRGPGMERADLLKDNGKIFVSQGNSLNRVAKRSVKVVVVGNPANTNCLVAAMNAPDLDPRNFSALTRLDHNRALAQIAIKTKSAVESIANFAIWGNHSPTMYPDVTHALIGDVPASKLLDHEWLVKEFIPTVQQRGKAIIDARGSSSAFSAASATIDHINNWLHGSNGVTSMAVLTDGLYDHPSGIYSSFPVTCGGNSYKVIEGLSIDEFSRKKIEASIAELVSERDAVKDLLK